MQYNRITVIEQFTDGREPLDPRPLITASELRPIPVQIYMAFFDAERKAFESQLRGPRKQLRSLEDIQSAPGWEYGLDEF